MRLPALASGTVAALAVVAASCGGADLRDTAVEARLAPPSPGDAPVASTVPASHAPASAGTIPAGTVPAGTVPAATPTGPSIRVTDGQTVVALDPATGGRRAEWADAAISLEGNWTVARDGDARASWFDAYGVLDRTGEVPAGLRPTVTSADGRWAVFAEPAPPIRAGEIGPARATSRFVVTDGAESTRELTLDGNFAPEAFGWFDETNQPMNLHLIEYMPPEHPSRYRVRTLDLTTGALGLPVSLRDKTILVDESMAGVSRTQVYAASSALLFTLYQPAPPAAATDGGYSEAWEYGFVHTLATPYAGVWCIDLPEELGMTGHSGALALSPDEQTLYVVTGAGKLGVIDTADAEALRVSRTVDLGVGLDLDVDADLDGESPSDATTTTVLQPVVAAGTDHVWIGMGRQLLMADPTSLEVQGRAELAAPVTALTLDSATHELLAAADGQLQRWTVDEQGGVTTTAALPLPDGLGAIARIAT